jgi:F-type H+-transporting ATPase subunit epsilon
MHVTVVSPEQAVFDGSADAVVAPAYDGQVGILPHHAPFLTLLGTGVLTVRQGGGGGGGGAATRFRVSGGFLQVVGDAVRIVADRVDAS